MAKDLLPDAQGSREFKSSIDRLVAEARHGNTPQPTKFEELAPELECDEDEDAFKAAVRKIGTAPKPPMPAADEE